MSCPVPTAWHSSLAAHWVVNVSLLQECETNLKRPLAYRQTPTNSVIWFSLFSFKDTFLMQMYGSVNVILYTIVVCDIMFVCCVDI